MVWAANTGLLRPQSGISLVYELCVICGPDQLQVADTLKNLVICSNNGGHARSWLRSNMVRYKNGSVIAQAAIARFPPRWPRFEPRSGHMGFVVDKAALR
jgi:hypothetical protein